LFLHHDLNKKAQAPNQLHHTRKTNNLGNHFTRANEVKWPKECNKPDCDSMNLSVAHLQQQNSVNNILDREVEREDENGILNLSTFKPKYNQSNLTRSDIEGTFAMQWANFYT
jgi:hypothetical protein